jgi:hypothetical protein
MDSVCTTARPSAYADDLLPTDAEFFALALNPFRVLARVVAACLLAGLAPRQGAFNPAPVGG